MCRLLRNVAFSVRAITSAGPTSSVRSECMTSGRKRRLPSNLLASRLDVNQTSRYSQWCALAVHLRSTRARLHSVLQRSFHSSRKGSPCVCCACSMMRWMTSFGRVFIGQVVEIDDEGGEAVGEQRISADESTVRGEERTCGRGVEMQRQHGEIRSRMCSRARWARQRSDMRERAAKRTESKSDAREASRL